MLKILAPGRSRTQNPGVLLPAYHERNIRKIHRSQIGLWMSYSTFFLKLSPVWVWALKSINKVRHLVLTLRTFYLFELLNMVKAELGSHSCCWVKIIATFFREHFCCSGVYLSVKMKGYIVRFVFIKTLISICETKVFRG